MGQGEFAQAREHLMAAIEKPSIGWNPVGDHEVSVLLADIGAMHRDIPLLAAYALQADEISLSLDHHLYHAIALRALGILDWLNGESAQAAARLTESCRIFQQIDTRWQLGRTLSDLGEVSAGLGRSEEAESYFARSRNILEDMGVYQQHSR